MVSTHAPSFGVKYPFAPKLFLNHNYFLQMVTPKALHTVATINLESRLLKWGHLINTSVHPSPFPSPQLLALEPSSSPFKNSSVPPPPNPSASSPSTRNFPQVCKWLPSPRSPRYNNSYSLLRCCSNLRPMIVLDFPFFCHHF